MAGLFPDRPYMYICMHYVCLYVLMSLCERGEREEVRGRGEEKCNGTWPWGYVGGQQEENVGKTAGKEQEGESMNMDKPRDETENSVPGLGNNWFAISLVSSAR